MTYHAQWVCVYIHYYTHTYIYIYIIYLTCIKILLYISYLGKYKTKLAGADVSFTYIYIYS